MVRGPSVFGLGRVRGFGETCVLTFSLMDRTLELLQFGLGRGDLVLDALQP